MRFKSSQQQSGHCLNDGSQSDQKNSAVWVNTQRQLPMRNSIKGANNDEELQPKPP
jgi:hypothetical protein